VHYSEIRPKVFLAPRYPKAAKQIGLEADCRLRIYVDEKGKVYNARVETCPKVFHEELLKTAYKWKFYPMKVEGKPIKTQMQYPVKFALSG
jgi:TonB family protein